ncbi:MAG: hypothetical protein J6Y20_11400 [Lachnospiraceae bacterium]|nr:hypothetical protein [Lachnospiraceae bacterium]
MNRARRELLKRAVAALEEADGFVNTALDEEQDCLDNMPENLSESERYEKMENAIGHLEDALENISSAMECIECASE